MGVIGGWRVLAPFRFREYRLLISALSISIFAEGMWAVVTAMQVIALDDDPASLSLVATCLGAGLVGFVLVGGIAADRINQRAIIIAVETVNVTAVAAVAVLSSLGALRIWHMALAAGILGIAAAFFFPAYSGWTSSFPLLALATFVVGVTDGAAGVIWGTLLQRRVPPESWAASRAWTSSSRWRSCRCRSPSPDRCRRSCRWRRSSWRRAWYRSCWRRSRWRSRDGT